MRYSKVFLAIVLMFVLVFGSSISAFATNTTYYDLTIGVSPDGGGTITADPGGSWIWSWSIMNFKWYPFKYESGKNVNVFISENPGFQFNHVEVNGSETPLTSVEPMKLKVKMTDNMSVVAYFDPEYTLTLSSSPSIGTQGGAGVFLEGDTSMVSTNDVDGYRFVNWTKDGNEVSTDLSFEYTMPSEDVMLVANYVPEYTLTLSSNPSIGTQNGAGVFLEGETSMVSTTDVDGYRFINWTKDGNIVSTDLSFEYTMPEGDVELIANYVPQYSVSVIAVPTEGGVVSGGGTFDEGAEIQVFATPNEHYDFLYWGWDEECVEEVNELVAYRALLLLEEPKLGEHNYYTETQNPYFTVYCDTILTAYFQEHPKYKVTTNYIDAASNKLLDSVNDYYYEGQAYTTVSETIPGYVLNGTPINASGTVGEEDIIVNYIYIVPQQPQIITEIITNTVTETVFIPTPTQPVVIEEEETPLGVSTFTDIDAFLAPLPATTEAAEEIEVDEEETPLADALPSTGQLPVEFFYGAGGLISAVGVMMRRKKK